MFCSVSIEVIILEVEKLIKNDVNFLYKNYVLKYFIKRIVYDSLCVNISTGNLSLIEIIITLKFKWFAMSKGGYFWIDKENFEIIPLYFLTLW